MPKNKLEDSVLDGPNAELLKENNPSAYQRLKKLEKGNWFYRALGYFVDGISLIRGKNFSDPKYNPLNDLYLF